jgi:small subunit ribosomal protein S3
MEEKKFVKFKEEELGVKEYVKNSLGKGRISNVTIEYTPVGEKIIVSTNRPGMVIGKKGEKIDALTRNLKKRFKLDNPHIEIKEIENEALDAQLIADLIALNLERRGSLKFKIIAYRTLRNIRDAGALGVEIILSGKLPSDRARTWRFAEGYLKKTGEPSKLVNRAMSQAKTIQGIVGIKVSILLPNTEMHDKIVIDEKLKSKIRENGEKIMMESENKGKVKKKEAKK